MFNINSVRTRIYTEAHYITGIELQSVGSRRPERSVVTVVNKGFVKAALEYVGRGFER